MRQGDTLRTSPSEFLKLEFTPGVAQTLPARRSSLLIETIERIAFDFERVVPELKHAPQSRDDIVRLAFGMKDDVAPWPRICVRPVHQEEIRKSRHRDAVVSCADYLRPREYSKILPTPTLDLCFAACGSPGIPSPARITSTP